MRVDNTAMEVTGGVTAPEWDRVKEDEALGTDQKESS
jgi:hypothetical protein